MMRTTLLSTVCVCLLIACAPAARSSTISYDARSFLLDGKRIFIFSGELHYWRVPEGEWIERIQRMKAAGLNAVSTPIPWVRHEAAPGRIDLSECERFLQVCRLHGMFVLARIGPITGADLAFDGVPYWLVAKKIPNIGLDDELYLRYVARWYNAVCPLVERYQVTNGGPIVLVQIDNEHERILGKPSSTEPGHLRTLSRAVRERGIEVPLYINYALWPPADIPDVIAAPDVFPGEDYSSLVSILQRHRRMWPKRPLGLAEFAVFKDYAVIGKPRPLAPSNLPAVYRTNLDTLLASGGSFINHYTATGMFNFEYSRRSDIGSLYYPEMPLSVAGGFNPSYWPLRIVGTWLQSFGPDLLAAHEVPLKNIQILVPASQTNDAKPRTAAVQARALAGVRSLYLFLRETQNKPYAFRLRIKKPDSGTTLTFPAAGWIRLLPRRSKLLVADFRLGTVNVLYSTSELFTHGNLGDTEYAVLYGDPDTPGEIAFQAARPPLYTSSSLRLTAEGSRFRVNYTHSSDDQWIRFDKTLVVITTRRRAARTWLLGEGNHAALLVSDADFASQLQTTATEAENLILCPPGEIRVTAFLATPPERILLDGRGTRFRTDDIARRFTIKTPSAPSVRLRLKRAKVVPEGALPDPNSPFYEIPDLSQLARLGFYKPGFVRLRTTLPKEAATSLSIHGNATFPPVLQINQDSLPGQKRGEGYCDFDLRGKLNEARNEVVVTLEFETVPEIEINTNPTLNLQWEASPGLKGERLLLFSRSHGSEWKNVALPAKPAPGDITWYAIPFTLHPKAAWEQPLLLNIHAADEALLWLNGRKFVRYTSRGPEEILPLPSSWLLSGQNLLAIAARGNTPVTAEITSDEDHFLMHRELELQW